MCPLELLGVSILEHLWGPELEGAASRITWAGITDNQGAANITSRFYTARQLGAGVLMHLAVECFFKELDVRVQRRPRRFNF